MTKDALQTFISGELLSGKPVATDEPLLVNDLLDSLAIMRLVAFIDKSLGIRVPPKDIKLANFATIDAIDAYLARQAAS